MNPPLCQRRVITGIWAGGTCDGTLVPARPNILKCRRCEVERAGSEDEMERAQKAWDEEETRQTPAQGCAELCDFELCRKAGRCDG